MGRVDITWTEAKRLAPKKRDTWVRVLLLNWWATPLTYLIARYTALTPSHLTLFGFALGVYSAWSSFSEHFTLGAMLYFAHFVLDGMDGKLSRIRKENDTCRGTMDFTLDGIVCALVVIGLAFGYEDHWLTALLLVWMSLHFLDMRFGAMVYNLRATKGITDSKLISSDTGTIYGNNWLISKYVKVQDKMERFGLNALPTTGEAAFLMFIVGPLTGRMYLMTILGILCIIPAMVGNYILAYKLAGKETT